MFPEQSALRELLVDLLSHGDVRQQHELFHHGVGVSVKMFGKKVQLLVKQFFQVNSRLWTHFSSLVWRSIGS